MSERPERLPETGIQSPDGRRFPWGPIQRVHAIGDYQVVEYHKDASTYSQPDAWGSHGQTMFHPYINGKDTHHGYTTLDSALVGAIAINREGLNGQAALYFDRMTLNH